MPEPRRREAPDRNLALELVRVTEAARHGRGPLGRPRREGGRRRRGGRRDARVRQLGVDFAVSS